jgi:DNA-binding transcriptional LysR family regulator
LLTRTTRSVAPTEAGERLLRTVGPRFEEIDNELNALSELRKSHRTIRITATDYHVDTIRWPKLTKFVRQYPDIASSRDHHRPWPDRLRRAAVNAGEKMHRRAGVKMHHGRRHSAATLNSAFQFDQ